MLPQPRKKRVPLGSISGNVVPLLRPRDADKDEKAAPSSGLILTGQKALEEKSQFTASSSSSAVSGDRDRGVHTKREVPSTVKLVSSYLHKCRHVRNAILRLLKATPEPRYNDLLRGLLANLDKIASFLEQRCRNKVHLTTAVEAQLLKCRGWLEMVMVPFYRKLVASPAACLSLLNEQRSTERMHFILRISACSNQALKRVTSKSGSNTQRRESSSARVLADPNGKNAAA
jgi:hypothetical protein